MSTIKQNSKPPTSSQNAIKNYIKGILIIILLIITQSALAQVGVGNTDPKATLDITASDITNPINTDGILIPRVSNLPAVTSMTTDQDGMLVFYTGTGFSGKGFYYWNQTSDSWVSIFGAKRINDLVDGKSDNDGTENGSSIFLGVNAGVNDDGSNNRNISLGTETLNLNTTGSNNFAVGFRALSSNTSGSANIAIGGEALQYNNGSGNIAISGSAMQTTTFGLANIAIGGWALRSNEVGLHNIAMGGSTLSNNLDGEYNVAIGSEALLANNNGDENLAIGYHAGLNNTGSGNVFLGTRAGFSETGSNKLYIDNVGANEVNALIYGEFDNEILRVNGEFQIGDPSTSGYAFPLSDSGAGRILTTNGSGQLYFSLPSSLFTDTDNQTLTLSGTTLSILDGNSIDISSIDTDTDDQTLSFTGNTLSIADGNSVDLSILNTGGDITNVTAGAGLSGGGNVGAITLTAAANNGLNIDAGADRIQLGGALTENTTISNGTNALNINLNNTGDFNIQDDGTNKLTVFDNGDTVLGGNQYWRVSNTGSGADILARLTNDGGDGLFQIYEGDNVSIHLNANGTSVFNEQGLDRDFRIESDNNTNMFRLDASTNSIGIAGLPDTDFHIHHNNTASSAGFKIQNQGGNNNWWRMFSNNTDGRLYLYSTLGGTSSRGNFNNNTGAYSATSDRRLKKDFKPLPFSWENFMNLETLSYLYKSQKDNKRSLGLIAQDVELIYPELVSYNQEDDVYHMNYSGFGVIAIKAVQELKEEVDSLKTENEILKSKLDKLESLEARLTALENKTESSEEIASVENN